jgi:hypothetical protein
MGRVSSAFPAIRRLFSSDAEHPVPLVIPKANKQSGNEYPAGFIEGLVPVVKEGITFYPIQVLLDSQARKLIIYNAANTAIAEISIDDEFLPIEWTRSCFGEDAPALCRQNAVMR